MHLLPGLSYMGYGYDILFGNPQSKGEADPGYREAIFDLTNHSAGATLNGYIVPNGISASMADSCDSQMQYQAIAGANAYSKLLDKSVYVGENGNSSFSLSVGYQHIFKMTANTSYLYTASYTQCSVYRATTNAPFALPAFTPNFYESIVHMPTTYDPTDASNEAYFYDFINLYFGTHYVLNAELGGMAGAQFRMNEYAFSSYSSSNLSISLSCEYAAQNTFDFAGMTKVQRQEAMDFQSATEDQETWYLGGRFPENGSWQEWATTLKNDSMPIVISLAPISALLTAYNFPDDKDIEDKRTALEAATNGYCEMVANDAHYNSSLTVLCNGPPPDKPLPAKSIFGGTYPDNHYGIYNPYTAGINCGSGFTSFPWITYEFDNKMLQHFCVNDTQLKDAGEDAMLYFGGLYSVSVKSGKSECVQSNPFTKKCACAEGMSSAVATKVNDGSTVVQGEMCYNATTEMGQTMLGGFYQTGEVQVKNVYTQTTSCPAGYLPYQVSHFHCDGKNKGDVCDLWLCANNVYEL